MTKKFLFGMLVTVLAFSVLAGCAEPADNHPLVGDKAWTNIAAAAAGNPYHASTLTNNTVHSILFKSDGKFEYYIKDPADTATDLGLIGFRGTYSLGVRGDYNKINYTITDIRLAARASLTDVQTGEGTSGAAGSGAQGLRKAAWKAVSGAVWTGDDADAATVVRNWIRDIAKDGIDNYGTAGGTKNNDRVKEQFDDVWTSAAETGATTATVRGALVGLTDISATVNGIIYDYNDAFNKFKQFTFTYDGTPVAPSPHVLTLRTNFLLPGVNAVIFNRANPVTP